MSDATSLDHLKPASSIFRPHFIQARGARLRAATFPSGTTTDRLCVLLNGQTEFIEKYFEVIDELRARGFCVVTMDWRGQGGSGRLLPDPLKVHIDDFSEYDDDLASLLEQVVAPLTSAAPVALAHSMGGHIILRALRDKPGRFSRVILSAPMIAVSARGTPPWLARIATWVFSASGQRDQWVFGMQARDPLHMGFESQIVTSDRARFQRTQDFITREPQIRVAGPTWGWLEAAYESMREMQRPGYAETISTPTLVFGSGRDRICMTAAARAFAARMPKGEFVLLDDAEHEILMENDSIRTRFWKAFDAFVDRS